MIPTAAMKKFTERLLSIALFIVSLFFWMMAMYLMFEK